MTLSYGLASQGERGLAPPGIYSRALEDRKVRGYDG
ncbi:unannotated protein [freshwater metagenome]|uniref:Unannotated protein n=1 Tax=freshwater metagenome TaxID=449393 RepID=A0A6J7IMX2_9ZZZZ